MSPEKPTYSVQAVERVCYILNHLKSSSLAVPLEEIAAIASLHKSSAFRYLRTLERHRFVIHDPETGGYRLGDGFAAVRTSDLDRLASVSRSHLERLRDQVHETTGIGVLDGTTVLFLDVVESQRAMRYVGRPGDRGTVHATSLGKAICSLLEEDEVRALLSAAGMPKHTDATITDSDEFIEVVRQVKETHYSVNDGESDSELRSISSPIRIPTLPAAVSVVGPKARLSDGHIAEVVPRLIQVARAIERDFRG